MYIYTHTVYIQLYYTQHNSQYTKKHNRGTLKYMHCICSYYKLNVKAYTQ